MRLAATIALNEFDLYGYGTSEGVKKAWDERGRGRHSTGGDPFHNAPKGRSAFLDNNPQRGAVLMKQHAVLKAQYNTLNQKLEKLSLKFDDPTAVHSTAAKMLHFIKRVGDWLESYGAVKDLALTAAGYIVGHLSGSVVALHASMMHAMAHLAPLFSIASQSLFH